MIQFDGLLFKSILCLRDQCVTVFIHACLSVCQLEDLHLHIVLSLNECILELECWSTGVLNEYC